MRLMPLLSGYSQRSIAQNISILCRESNCDDERQHRRNIAIAYAHAREQFKKYGKGRMPAYLSGRR